MLSVNAIKVLPAVLWILCGCAVLTSYRFVIEPGHSHIVKRLTTRNVLESRIQSDVSLLRLSKEISRRSRIARKVFEQSGVDLGTTLAIGRFLPHLQSLAQGLHIRIRSILIQRKVKIPNNGLLMSREANIVLRGSFRDELTYLRSLTKFSGLAVRLDAASFSAHGSGSDVIAKASISLLSSAPPRERKR